MFDPLEVPGYDVLAPLDRNGRSWKAVAGADRTRVVVRGVLGGEETRQRLRRDAASWGSMPTDHVVRVRDVVAVADDMLVVVSDYAPGGGLDTLLTRRGALDDGEVVTLVVPLAEAIAAAHRHGLAHGRITAGNVVFGEDGRPMLTDAILAPADHAAAGADVTALVEVARAALGERRGGPLLAALQSTYSSAGALAAAVRGAAPARPIDLSGARAAQTIEAPPPPSRSRTRFMAVSAVVIGVVLLAGLAAGRHDASRATHLEQPQPGTHAVSPSPAALETTTVGSRSRLRPRLRTPSRPAVMPSAHWWGIVQRLERGRVAAFVTALHESGLRPVGLRIRLLSVRVLRAGADRAVVRVTDGWASYLLVDADGQVSARRPAQPHRLATLLMRHGTHGWRVLRVLA